MGLELLIKKKEEEKLFMSVNINVCHNLQYFSIPGYNEEKHVLLWKEQYEVEKDPRADYYWQRTNNLLTRAEKEKWNKKHHKTESVQLK